MKTEFTPGPKKRKLEEDEECFDTMSWENFDSVFMMDKSGDKTSMLPGMRKELNWLLRDNSGGVKACLEEQMKNVTERLQRSIDEQMGG